MLLSGPRLSLLSSNGCSALGLNEFEAINAITVYPNPATEYFLITSPQMEMNELEIYNVLGQLVKSQKLTQINNFIKIEICPLVLIILEFTMKENFLNQIEL